MCRANGLIVNMPNATSSSTHTTIAIVRVNVRESASSLLPLMLATEGGRAIGFDTDSSSVFQLTGSRLAQRAEAKTRSRPGRGERSVVGRSPYQRQSRCGRIGPGGA
jgi:hypothetical protein